MRTAFATVYHSNLHTGDFNVYHVLRRTSKADLQRPGTYSFMPSNLLLELYPSERIASNINVCIEEHGRTLKDSLHDGVTDFIFIVQAANGSIAERLLSYYLVHLQAKEA